MVWPKMKWRPKDLNQSSRHPFFFILEHVSIQKVCWEQIKQVSRNAFFQNYDLSPRVMQKYLFHSKIERLQFLSKGSISRVHFQAVTKHSNIWIFVHQVKQLPGSVLFLFVFNLFTTSTSTLIHISSFLPRYVFDPFARSCKSSHCLSKSYALILIQIL